MKMFKDGKSCNVSQDQRATMAGAGWSAKEQAPPTQKKTSSSNKKKDK